jgi:hypothetical protein
LGGLYMSAVRLSCFTMAINLLLVSSAAAEESNRSPILSLTFSGSANNPGWIYVLNPVAGYRFSRHFEVTGGVPLYMVRAPETSTSDGINSKNGIGNALLNLKLLFDNSNFSFNSTLNGTAPTGNEKEGFSTGRGTFDWTNYFEVSAGRWTPFGSAGIANTISDTHFFSRPFSSLGLVGHFEGGASIKAVQWISIGGSGYAVTPSGQQKIYSKLVGQQSAGSNSSRGNTAKAKNPKKAFESTGITIDDGESSRDHGLSGWVDFNPRENISIQLGYSRSIYYESDGCFFSISLDVIGIFRH